MAASAQDQLLRVAPNTGWQLDASGISDASVTSFGLISATGLPTTTAVILTVDRVDSSGVATPSKMERIKGIVSGTSVISCTRGFEGTAQAHAAGAVVEIVISAGLWNSVIDGTDIHKATEKTTPADADELGLIDSAASYVLKRLTWANLKATLLTYFDTIYPPKNGWISYSTVAPTRASADDPTYVLTFAGVDLTSTMSVGMKVKWTQNSTVRYGIVTAIAFSTDTTITVYGGTDYDVDDTATYAISAFNYSTQKAPLSFPLDPTKWTVEATDTTVRAQATPTQNTWYNLGSFSMGIPIGAWVVSYFVTLQINDATAGNWTVASTLSTANNSEIDNKWTGAHISASPANSAAGSSIFKENTLILAAKATYYLNTRTTETGVDNIYNRNEASKAIIRAICAYL